MPQPSQDVDTLCEDLLQDLPPETVPMARAFKAFTRARTVQTPVHLRRLVLRYGGLAQCARPCGWSAAGDGRGELPGAAWLEPARPPGGAHGWCGKTRCDPV